MKIEDAIKSNAMPDGRKTAIHIMYTANAIQDKSAEILKPFGITPPQFNVLRILRGQKGKPANLCTIQERMISKMSNTTRLVDKLITKGLVNRVTCEENRRKVEISITEEGLKLLSEIDEPIDLQNENIIKNLSSEEIEQLNNILEKIRG
ncbi:MarR family winged helix-turn-helix transcriptional regulator [Galbibacter orientalis]|uniref:Transcriptional regulator n=1 Tax=Galbibacter orientalis DSM 19592 TaxID=926559 RepID=I3C7V2_9FLAO|nr:MarR family transcriptional regulator [Galbibacter orientalis]EIJ39695.1 transcriptional regulator [Galbibacter orientalis DSM 19592]